MFEAPFSPSLLGVKYCLSSLWQEGWGKDFVVGSGGELVPALAGVRWRGSKEIKRIFFIFFSFFIFLTRQMRTQKPSSPRVFAHREKDWSRFSQRGSVNLGSGAKQVRDHGPSTRMSVLPGSLSASLRSCPTPYAVGESAGGKRNCNSLLLLTTNLADHAALEEKNGGGRRRRRDMMEGGRQTPEP